MSIANATRLARISQRLARKEIELRRSGNQ